MLNSCFISPIIEETLKLFFLKYFIKNDQIRKNRISEKRRKLNEKTEIKTEKLDKNVDSKTDSKIDVKLDSKEIKDNKENKENKGNKMDKIRPSEEHSLRSYMTMMTAISIGIKVADNVRRILLYTHPNQKHKMFFSIARSFFPGTHLIAYLLFAQYVRS